MLKRIHFLYRLFLCCFTLVHSAAFAGNGMAHQADSITVLINKYHFTQNKLSRNLLDELYGIASQSKDSSILVKALYWDASIDYAQGTNDETLISRIDEALASFNPTKHLYEYTQLLYAHSLANTSRGNYPEAFNYIFNALNNIDHLDDDYLAYKVLNLLGNLCSYIQNYNMAEQYYGSALLRLSPEQIEYYQLLNNKYRILFLRGNVEQAIDSLLSIIPEFERFNNIESLITGNLNLGAFYSKTPENDKAFESIYHTLNLIRDIDNDKFKIVVYQNMANYYLSVQDFGKSYEYIMMAKEIATRNNSIAELPAILHSLSITFEGLGRLDSAYYYMKEYDRLNTTLINNPKNIETYQSYVNILMETSANKLTIAEQELLLRDRQVIVVIVSALAVILIILLLLIISQQKRKSMKQKALLEEIEKKDLEERLEHQKTKALLKETETKELEERLLYQKELEALQNERLDLQVREISSYSLQLSNKNHILQQILDTTKQHEPTESGNNSKEIIRKIEKIAKNNILTDKEWNDFMLHFEKVHPRFFDKLQKQYPSLTNNDLKLCVYIRIGMSMKQIAQLLNIFPDSVKTNRYRLRKKFNLNDEANLNDFLQSI